MTSCIYQILNKVSGKRYVGSASDFAKRCHAHRKKLHLGTHHSPKLQNSWDKHGSEAFVFSIIEVVPDKTKLTEREQHWIDAYDVVANGYNINPIAGSSRGVLRGPRSQEVKDKIRNAQKGKVLSPEHKAAIKASYNPGMTGKQQSEHFKQRMSEVQKGRVKSPEEIEKNRQSRFKNKMARIGHNPFASDDAKN